ncbi:MAG: hypothetical protein HRU07_05145 [Nitrosopumilus sp.]|nr:hypothetical protein [Nitrosopumilus sp.]NRA05534.1 hypothetical protein [Nitrosopumilus sp.]
MFAYTVPTSVEPTISNPPQSYRLFLSYGDVYTPTETLYTNFHVQGVDARDPSTFIDVSVEIRDPNAVLVYQNTLTEPETYSL